MQNNKQANKGSKFGSCGPWVLVASLSWYSTQASAEQIGPYTLEAGHPSLQEWLLPDTPPYPANNKPTAARVALGKKLFFDPRLSGDGNMSCGTCHNPLLGWSDGLPTARGVNSKALGRATPTVINTAYNSLQMWDGRKRDLEDQATGPIEADVEMNMDMGRLTRWLQSNREYQAAFAAAYPDEAIGPQTLAKAIASFERTVISNNSPFDRWVKGDASAMTAQAVRGFRVFLDANKGNCAGCHAAPNFTDDGFHNIGLSSFGVDNPDLGRFQQRAVRSMKGAFKTPTLRDIALTAPYFHDGSAASLAAVIDHYAEGGAVKTNLSPEIKTLTLSEQEQQDLVAFMEALTSEHVPLELPKLPANEPLMAEFETHPREQLAER